MEIFEYEEFQNMDVNCILPPGNLKSTLKAVKYQYDIDKLYPNF